MRKHQDRKGAVIRVLKQALKDRGISERALCAELGEHKNYINEIFHGQHRVSVEEFIRIAEALEVSPLDLLSRILRP